MTSWLKYLIFGLLFLTVIVFVITFSTRHQTNIVGTQAVQVGLESADVGEIRNHAEGRLDKKSIVSNLILEVAKQHNDQGKNIRINYVLLDEEGEETNNDDEINSVQFEVLLLGDDDRVESTSEQRIQLDEITAEGG